VNGDAEQRKTGTRATFNHIAPDYDVAGPGCFAYFGKRLVDAASVAAGHRVLDVACGRGAVLFPAAERTGAADPVIGIDLAEEMLNAARAEAADRGLAVSLLPMDAEQLQFSDASFDRVLCGFGVMFFPHVERALSGFRRVLKPDGRVAVSTWQVSQTEDLNVVLAGSGGEHQPHPGWVTEPEALSRLLIEAGFSDIRVTVDTKSFRYDSLDQYWQNARGTGLRRILDGLDSEQTRRMRAALADRVQPHQRPDGLYLDATALLAVAER
jgi:O-methyltransferase/aklanonic acid methyltransferase